ncbi:MAG: hypothetical protein HYT79_06995 [Elusimicrobia bacterium]|nr:hypothetical protein [Elusimicrobiota bacterium]
MKKTQIGLAGLIIAGLSTQTALWAESSREGEACATVKQELRKTRTATAKIEGSLGASSKTAVRLGSAFGETRAKGCKGTECVHGTTDPHLGTLPVRVGTAEAGKKAESKSVKTKTVKTGVSKKSDKMSSGGRPADHDCTHRPEGSSLTGSAGKTATAAVESAKKPAEPTNPVPWGKGCRMMGGAVTCCFP